MIFGLPEDVAIGSPLPLCNIEPRGPATECLSGSAAPQESCSGAQGSSLGKGPEAAVRRD